MSAKIVGVSGSLSENSKTRRLVSNIVDRVSSKTRLESEFIDIIDLTPDIALARRRDGLPHHLDRALAAVEQADLLVVGSPVYKGSYSGLFKLFFDLIDVKALVRKPIAITATGGGDRHALVVEHQLRPLFGFFNASTLPTSFYASDRDLVDGELRDPVLIQRLDALVEESIHVLERRLVHA
ncbi:FMN reductase [Kaistia terrae]|uniref:FMN reductase n=1 Tax=Kaistia terrae TaxID=537017 RepID=A0ABW0Q305_9HYPH|nr:FMN reductase [Kaistia terrae]MCX5579703.1 FMN reductase [Kaistia terrae]